MTTQVLARSRMRPILLVSALAVAAACLWLVAHLYTDAAPFHQPYRVATDDQNRQVMLRLVAAVVGVPLAGVLLVTGLLARPAMISVRRALLLLGLFLLVVGLHSCALPLPYGFGSGYEHASSAQHQHLDFTIFGGLVLLGSAAACLVASLVVRTRRWLPMSSLIPAPADLGQ